DGTAHGLDQGCTVRLQGVKCTRTDQRLDGAPVDGMAVPAGTEIEQAGKRPPRLTRSDDGFDRRLTGALDSTQPIADGAWRPALGGVLVSHRGETVTRFIDVRWQHRYIVVQRIPPEDLDL